ncbi:putative low-specificity L-threonine aldolase [Penicillium brasilianum]|uniref:Putative low-specificity L-threonine aldolase n=1 Tax=Penicillium brasilianum TaxID=104259 RepID=A0A1S9RKN3_PENBI|nr:putative low-specificity L-threonine aldolase [Penicillium brasilianum]
MNPHHLAQPLRLEQNAYFFRYNQTPKLKDALEKAGRDFRSDVVTVPTEGMMQAIIEASVGDDIYDPEGDASVNALQNKLVELSGKEAALWTLSGTMGNQICLRTHLTQPPHTVLLDHRAHVQCWESGALPVFSQAAVTQVHPQNGVHLTLEDVKRNMIADGNIHFPPTRVVSLENTLSGTILPLKDAKEISEFVRSFPVPTDQKPIAMHLDGARLFDAVVAEGVDLKEYCACFDSISFCLAKGVGAPMGSVIVGNKRFIERAKWFRKMFGGGTRQPGMMAAAASAALDQTLSRLPVVHAMAASVAKELETMGYKFALPVQTNMIVLDLEVVGIPPAAFVGYCKNIQIAVFPNGRLVFHHQTSQDGTLRLLKALRQLMSDKEAGIHLIDDKVTGGYS